MGKRLTSGRWCVVIAVCIKECGGEAGDSRGLFLVPSKRESGLTSEREGKKTIPLDILGLQEVIA